MIWVIIMVLIGVILLIGFSAISQKEKTGVEKTKILATNVKQTNKNYFHTETTFMVYYSDGTHKADTVANGCDMYNFYMGKLEA